MELGHLTPSELSEAHRSLSLALLPADDTTLVKHLVRLRVSTASRQVSDLDQDLVLEAYAETLAEYPADVVASAMKRAPKLFKFWPTVSELVEMCEWRSRKRRLMLHAIEQELARRAA